MTNQHNQMGTGPSSAALIRSTFLAFITAMILLFAAILPAEYGFDPSGIGEKLGLKKMGEIKVSLAEELALEEAKANNPPPQIQPTIEENVKETPAPAPNVANKIEAVPTPSKIEDIIIETTTVETPLVEAKKVEVPKAEPIKVEPPKPSINQKTVSFNLKPNASHELKVDLKKGKQVSYQWQSSGGKINFDIHGDSVPLKISYHNYAKGSEVTSSGNIVAAFDGFHGWFWRNRSGKTVTITLQVEGDFNQLKVVK